MANAIRYYSTNLKTASVSFGGALLKGQAPDRGLFMPETIPVFSPAVLATFSKKKYYEIAFAVAQQFLGSQIPDDTLKAIAQESYNFPVPLEKVYGNVHVMRLDQGPTASFKDFAARMMGRLMQYYLAREKRELLILTATSGDTGSAIANAFYGLDNIKVVVLFPEAEVTSTQRKQMTTLGSNIQIIAIDGKFDDCQALVKRAFSDSDLDYLKLSSANSINIGRLIPQIVYYFYSFSHLRKGFADDSVIFSVPSGNFGDMMGGLIAKRMGLPVKKIIIATNENDEFPVFLKTGAYTKIEPSKNCISSAMNVGHPSNLARVVALYGGIMDEKGYISQAPDLGRMQNEIYAVKITDAETKATIRSVYDDYQTLLEPHGSVGWTGLQKYLAGHGESPEQLCVTLETAHPAKFPETIREILGIEPERPKGLEGLEDKEESFVSMHNDFEAFKTFLTKTY